MVMVVPIDADVNVTQNIAQEHRQQRLQVGEFGRAGHLQFQHHDGDDDGDDAVAEGFQPVLFHGRYFNRRARSVHLKVARFDVAYR